MKTKELVKVLLVSALLIIVGFKCGINAYFIDNPAEVKNYEKLNNEGIDAVAFLDSTYTKVKLNSATIDNRIKYYFLVDNKKYSGEFSFDPSKYTSSTVNIKYLPNDPSINTADIASKLEKARENADSKTNLYIGIILIGVGILMLLGYILKQVKERKEQKAINNL